MTRRLSAPAAIFKEPRYPSQVVSPVVLQAVSSAYGHREPLQIAVMLPRALFRVRLLCSVPSVNSSVLRKCLQFETPTWPEPLPLHLSGLKMIGPPSQALI